MQFSTTTFLMLCVLMAGLASPATANGTGCPIHTKQTGPHLPNGLTLVQLEELYQWIGENSAYQVHAKKFARSISVTTCKHGDVLRYEGDDIVVEPNYRALFDVQTRHVHLILPFDAGNDRHLSTLLHELVHDVQTRHRRHWTCWPRAELEAYRLQERWLRQRGIEMDFDYAKLIMHNRCLDDVHPSMKP